jgi:hypothetical protein
MEGAHEETTWSLMQRLIKREMKENNPQLCFGWIALFLISNFCPQTWNMLSCLVQTLFTCMYFDSKIPTKNLWVKNRSHYFRLWVTQDHWSPAWESRASGPSSSLAPSPSPSHLFNSLSVSGTFWNSLSLLTLRLAQIQMVFSLLCCLCVIILLSNWTAFCSSLCDCSHPIQLLAPCRHSDLHGYVTNALYLTLFERKEHRLPELIGSGVLQEPLSRTFHADADMMPCASLRRKDEASYW